MTRSLIIVCLLSGCSLGPVPLEATGVGNTEELSSPADAGALSWPADGGVTSQPVVDTPCGSVACTATQFCVRRYGGIDGGGFWPDHCAEAATSTPTCADAWTNATCAPTACRDVITTGGHFIDCWGQ